MKLLRISISSLAAALALAATAVPAQAGTYDVLACDAAPGAVNHSWTYETNDSTHIASSTTCPASGDFSGLLADDKLNTAGVPAGNYGQWIVRAPSGTTISRIQLRRFLYLDGGSGWTVYGRQADGSTLSGETCTVQPGHDDCSVGGFAAHDARSRGQHDVDRLRLRLHAERKPVRHRRHAARGRCGDLLRARDDLRSHRAGDRYADGLVGHRLRLPQGHASR